MKKTKALAALGALAQDSRLDIFRILVVAGSGGLAAGTLSQRLHVAPNTLTFHLDQLRSAGLVTVRRNGRSMIYTAQYETMNALLAFLTENCCQGDAEACMPRPFCDPINPSNTWEANNDHTPNKAPGPKKKRLSRLEN